MGTTPSGAATPRGRQGPSGLSLLLARQVQDESPGSSSTPTPTLEYPNGRLPTDPAGDVSLEHPSARSALSPVRSFAGAAQVDRVSVHSETTPLLVDLEAAHHGNGGLFHPSSKGKERASRLLSLLRRPPAPHLSLHAAKDTAVIAVQSLPAVLLGTLLNILDGVSYGMIIFPAAGVFVGLGGTGVSMFFVSAIIAQLIYSAGGSGFAGANGSMMIEVVPFFHILANSIAEDIGEDNPRAVLATTILAFAFSSILTGLMFFLLGALRLGSLIGFFPRHILVGCIGGVGVFLVITGFTVSTGMPEEDFDFSLEALTYVFLTIRNVLLWAPALALAVVLRLITHKYEHQLIFPMYFLAVPVIFYIVVAAAHLNMGALRDNGWLFDMGTSREPWYHFYTLFDFRAVQWDAFWATLPTQLALLFFNILHPPLNVPALAVSLDHDVDTNKELVAHGYSNFLAGALGTVPNYLVYVNTLLFYRVGGTTRVSGFMLAAATAVLLLIGTGPISYIPVMVVGALIFVLGIDLVKEALWDTRHRVSRMEYITIASIMICMTVWDFVIGVIFGIVVSCVFFVVQSSQRKSIRTLHTGETVMSTVRRPGAHRAYIREVSRQTSIVRLQGFLFFGTITHVEETIRTLVEGPAWQRNPVRFLILDLSLVAGVDMSAAEALVRVQRLLASRRVVLVLCGFSLESNVGRSLRNVELLDTEGVELFATFNDALEWTENVYLRTWFSSQKTETQAVVLPGREASSLVFEEAVAATPRNLQLVEAGWRTIARDHSPPDDEVAEAPEPYNTLVKVFSSYGPVDRDGFAPLIQCLERVCPAEGTVLWRQDDESDGLYIVESGVLRATYQFGEHTRPTEESMVPGTLAGELSTLSGLSRNATCVVERQAVLWKLSTEHLRRLEEGEPKLAREFTRLVLKAAKLDYDTLIAALATRQ
ncbi:sulfate transporter family-domain-containing protein [Rhodofomes roseus]|uniref:Sulfate transporter family-domain-containing protein n=1 Tax=Rhodofomes roseus TaxID=34475 RepID=A0ABQ8KQJ8_9APHY|nr:sulfate transporter family-domain-containing protein [Rhodofomes roseus]KAH9840810.1 sulfate transporter family-domain-containing protein [Rhodofomes roseus]